MILYQLKCADGHGFEAWFRDSEAFDVQQRRGDVVCPLCGTTSVSKAPMAPHLASGAVDPHERRAHLLAARILEAVSEVRDEVRRTCDDVGSAFPEEARRIHYGEARARGIYGEATVGEAAELKDEGIEVFVLPAVPDKRRS